MSPGGKRVHHSRNFRSYLVSVSVPLCSASLVLKRKVFRKCVRVFGVFVLVRERIWHFVCMLECVSLHAVFHVLMDAVDSLNHKEKDASKRAASKHQSNGDADARNGHPDTR